MTGNQYHTQPDFSSATFPHQRSTSPQTPPSLWTQMLLPIKSYPVSLSHHVGLHGVKLLLLRGPFKGYFLLEAHNSAFCFNSRYDCYSADNGLCAAGVWKEIAVLATQFTFQI